MENYKQLDIFKHTEAGRAMRLSLAEAQQLTIQSLQAYAYDKTTWVVGFSGGKDSTALATFLDYAFSNGQLKRPENLIIAYSDTLMELPSLEYGAHALLNKLQGKGWQVRRSKPQLEVKDQRTERFFVTMLGKGYPPPNNRFRWCTDRMKGQKIDGMYKAIAEEYGNDYIGFDGIRKGESAVRDRVITTSCSVGDGECGQGWFHTTGSGQKLSPILHWRACNVWDWIIEACFEHDYPIASVIETYGVDITDDGFEEPLSARTGCIGCPLVTTGNEKHPKPDKALATVLLQENWSHLKPFERLSEIYWRLRWDTSMRHINLKGQKGCLTLQARLWALEEILKLQSESARLALAKGRAPYTLISAEEEAVIRQMVADRVFPDPKRYAVDEFDRTPQR